jgi:hypothetical protein
LLSETRAVFQAKLLCGMFFQNWPQFVFECLQYVPVSSASFFAQIPRFSQLHDYYLHSSNRVLDFFFLDFHSEPSRAFRFVFILGCIFLRVAFSFYFLCLKSQQHASTQSMLFIFCFFRLHDDEFTVKSTFVTLIQWCVHPTCIISKSCHWVI